MGASSFFADWTPQNGVVRCSSWRPLKTTKKKGGGNSPLIREQKTPTPTHTHNTRQDKRASPPRVFVPFRGPPKKRRKRTKKSEERHTANKKKRSFLPLSGPGVFFFASRYHRGGSAAFDLPVIGPVTGPAAGVAWKLYETSAQLSASGELPFLKYTYIYIYLLCI